MGDAKDIRHFPVLRPKFPFKEVTQAGLDLGERLGTIPLRKIPVGITLKKESEILVRIDALSIVLSLVLAEAHLAKATVEASFGGFRVTLSTDKPVFFTWANVKGIPGEFDDNSFTLLPDRPRTLTFVPKAAAVTAADFKRAFSVTHLRETY